MSFSVKHFGGLAIIAVALSAFAAFAADKETVADRLKPVGELCMVGDPCASQQATQTAGASAAARSGEEIFKGKCSTCHATGAAGAPKFGDATAWAPRLEKGIETLYQSAINGFQGMPAKGLCFDCSDEELKAAVDYMVEHAK